MEDAYLKEKVLSTISIGLTYISVQENLKHSQRKVKDSMLDNFWISLMTHLKIRYRSIRSSIRFSRCSRRVLYKKKSKIILPKKEGERRRFFKTTHGRPSSLSNIHGRIVCQVTSKCHIVLLEECVCPDC